MSEAMTYTCEACNKEMALDDTVWIVGATLSVREAVFGRYAKRYVCDCGAETFVILRPPRDLCYAIWEPKR